MATTERAAQDAAEELHLDIDALRARADRLLADPLYWFPVRHHSPGVARHLRAALRARRPRLLLVEGPAEASALVPHLVDARTKPPVAIYTSYRDDGNVLGLNGVESASPDIPARFGVWYPMLPYSPEYVALQTAQELGAEVLFVDLPHHGLIESAAARGLVPAAQDGGAPAPAREGEAGGEAEAPAEGEAAAAGGVEQEERADLQPSWERLAVESRFYQELARVAGFRSFGECWDALFEVGERHADHEAFRRDLAYFCAAVRATTPKERMAGDGTWERERYMWRAIREALAARALAPEEAFVVTGGFHLFLDREDETPPPPLPAGTVYATVAPYSYLRASELTGYGAGVRAPMYYQRLWERAGKAGEELAPVEAMVEHVVAVLARGRKSTTGLSSADAISVTQHARMLATLRGHRAPTLDDVRDALVTCCCKGRLEEEGVHLAQAMADVEIGTAIGRVTPAMGQLPLVHDFYAQLDALELGEITRKERVHKLVLHLQKEPDARRSIFLHRLRQLGVPLFVTDHGQDGGPELSTDGTKLYEETWRLRWGAGVEAELVEKNLYGDCVESAAAAMLDEQLSKEATSASKVARMLLGAVEMHLPGLAARLYEAMAPAIDADRALPSLADAVTALHVLDRKAAQRDLPRDLIAALVVRAYGKACFTIPDHAAVPEEDRPGLLRSLLELLEALHTSSGALDADLFVENLRTAYAASTVPYLRGAFSGLLTDLRFQPPEALAAGLAAFARERPETMITAGDYLQGMLAASRVAITLGADALVAAVDELLRAAAWSSFLVMLPRLRQAFEQLDRTAWRWALAERVAQRYRLAEAAQLARLSTSAEAAARMAAIDRQVAAIMKDWSF